jgi:site-specific DNA-methyltransferase (adenine-specific)
VTPPYYQDDLVTLYHGDCREITTWLDADVLVTDPPYGISWQTRPGWKNANGGGGHRSTGQATSIANDSDRTARDDVLRLWGARRAAVFGDILQPKPAGTVHALIYAKPADAGIKGARAGRRKDVEVIWLVGPWPVGVGGKSSVIGTGAWVAGPRGVSVRSQHPHAKPLDVMQEVVDLSAGLVADPFAGSGSSLVAAKLLGRRCIGVEVDERYCEVIAKRMAQSVLDFGDGAA